MFYIQTQDGELPYVYRVFRTEKGAHKAAMRFMRENTQEGAIAVCTAFHGTRSYFFRDEPSPTFVEEIYDENECEVVETVYH